MRADALAVDCPAREPDPVLLEQLSALAAASIPPAARPWWQRFTVKTGAAAVAGALLISGATADAEHRPPAPIAAPIVATPSHVTPAPRHKASKPVTQNGYAPVSSPVVGSVRHAGNRAQHHAHGRNKKKQDGNSNGGGSQNAQGQVPLERLATPLQMSSLQTLQPLAHAHDHARHRSHSHH